MSDYTKENISVHRYKPQRSIYWSRCQRSVFAQELLGRRYEFDHAFRGKAVAGTGAGSGSWSGGVDGCKGAIVDGFVGSRTMTKDEGVVVGDDGNGSMGIVADQESTGFFGRGRLTAPKSGV